MDKRKNILMRRFIDAALKKAKTDGSKAGYKIMRRGGVSNDLVIQVFKRNAKKPDEAN